MILPLMRPKATIKGNIFQDKCAEYLVYLEPIQEKINYSSLKLISGLDPDVTLCVSCHCPDELHRLWELLLAKLADKGMKLQQALVLVQFLRQYDEVMFWIHDKVSAPSTGVSAVGRVIQGVRVGKGL